MHGSFPVWKEGRSIGLPDKLAFYLGSSGYVDGNKNSVNPRAAITFFPISIYLTTLCSDACNDKRVEGKQWRAFGFKNEFSCACLFSCSSAARHSGIYKGTCIAINFLKISLPWVYHYTRRTCVYGFGHLTATSKFNFQRGFFRRVLLGWQLSDCGFCQYHLITKSAIT